MTPQLNRRYRLTAYQRPTGGARPTRAQTVVQWPLRLKATITKTVKSEPNTCEIVLYNLAAKTREELARPGLVVQLEAGHEDGLRLLWFGDVRHAWSEHVGTEWVTQILAGEGAHAHATARATRSYPPGATVRQVLAACADSLGLALPPALAGAAELDAQFANGYALEGWARDHLTRLLAPYGYRWSVQGGKLQVLRDDQVRPGSAFLIDVEDGMIGAPDVGAPQRGTKKRSMTTRVLLYPEIVPGSVVRINSRAVKTQARAESVKHALDTHGQDWTTEVEVTLR